MKRILLISIIIVCAAATLFGQTKSSLGMEPTPKNFNAAIPSATARAGQAALPAQVDLSATFPKPGYQGEQSSCVAWATAYGVKSYHENKKRNWGANSNETTFSPSYVYNQINNGKDAGSSIPAALELIKTQGVATLKTMPYGDYRQQPGTQAKQEAAQFRAESYERLDGANTAALKAVLAAGNPIVAGMYTFENFLAYSGGVYSSATGANLGGHAMVVVGYDDGKNAFKIMNSWGDRWGEKGFVWYSYKLYAEKNHTSMVLYDKPNNTPATSYPPNSLTASAGAYADRIQVSWDEVKNAEYYIVFRADGSPEKFAKIAEVRGTTFVDTKARPKTDYFYSVKSVGPGGESGFSSTARGNLKADNELGSPRNLQGVFEAGAIKLLWDSVQDAEGYHVYRWDNGPEQWVRIGSSKVEGYKDAKLPAGSVSERYVVSAFVRTTESKAGPGIAVAIPPAQKPPEPPAAPASVTASQGAFPDKIEIKWNSVPGANSYILRKWSDKKNDWTDLARPQGTAYTDTNVPEKKAVYCVVAIKGSLQSEASAIAEGWLSTAPAKKKPSKFDDDSYREEFFTRAEKFFGDEKFFSDSNFFTSPSAFFNDFEEENFFFFDEKAFFHVDEKFFQKPDDFFGDSKGKGKGFF